MSSITDLLNGYPDFMDKRTSSNIYKRLAGKSNLIDEFKRDYYIVMLRERLDRPFKLWINQQNPYAYSVNYQVNLPQGIKQIMLYSIDLSSNLVLVQDSGELNEGITSYSNSYSRTTNSVLPTRKFYIHVIDFDNNIYEKGYPENDTLNSDMFDHDTALDDIGVNWGITRRTYNLNISEGDYPKTMPPFFIDGTEADYWYEQRIWQFIKDYSSISLPLAEIKRHLSFLPVIMGKWEETGNPLDSCYFYFYGVLEDIPANINFATEENCQAIIDRALPCGDGGEMIITSVNPTYNPKDILSLKESISYILNYPNESASIFETFIGTVTTPIHEGMVFNEYLQMICNLSSDGTILNEIIISSISSPILEADVLIDNPQFNVNTPIIQDMILNEQITFIETLTALYHDTDTDFATDTLTNTSIIGTGSSAYIKLTGGTGGNQAKHPTAGSQSGSGGAWYDDYNVQGVTRTYDSSDSTFSQCTNGGWSKKINHNGYGFSLPSNVMVSGVKIDIVCDGGGSTESVQATINAGGTSKSLTGTAPASKGTLTLGGINNMWGGLPTDPTYYNNNFSTDIQINAPSNYGDVYYVTVTVYYTIASSGTLLTPAINTVSNGLSWNLLETSQNVPGPCILTYDILKASDGSVLLSGLSAPFDLSGLTYQNIKIRVNFATSDPSYTPQLDWLRVSEIIKYGVIS